jgi:hypothetical protein
VQQCPARGLRDKYTLNKQLGIHFMAPHRALTHPQCT